MPKCIKIKLLISLALITVLLGCKTGEEQGRKKMKVTYKTVTEVYDWGPGISKIILETGEDLKPDSLSTVDFKVESNRVFKDFDFSTFKPMDNPTDHIAERTVLDVYISDSMGNRAKKGSTITMELEVGPTLVEGSPFNYDMGSNFNVFVDTTYNISTLNPIKLKNGRTLEIAETNRDNDLGNINLIADEFINNLEFSHNDIALKYATFNPDNNKEKDGSTPLIIWLHGAGEGGNNTLITIMGNKVVNLATKEIQELFGDNGAYILAPQTPTLWMDIDGSKTYNTSVPENMGTSYYTETLMELIKSYVESNPKIDKNRIYIGGCSNGGYMTINMLVNYPDYFAAAYPSATPYSSSWLTDEKVEILKDQPIWLVHAKTDGIVPVYQGKLGQDYSTYNLSVDEDGNNIALDNNSNNLYRRLKSAGAKNIYYSLYNNVKDKDSGYEYMGHWSWIYSLNNDPTMEIDGKEITLFSWLAGQSR